MNIALKALIRTMLNKKCIGGKHTPEANIIKSKTRRLPGNELKGFEKEYNQMIEDQYIIRKKKKTGKGIGWHIWLNPKKVHGLREMIKNE